MYLLISLSDTYKLAVKLLKRQAKECNRTFTSPEGEKITISDIAHRLETVQKWIYPKIYNEEIRRVVYCEKCKFYKKFRKKGSKPKSGVFFACAKDMKRRDPMFYCAEGDPKDDL